MNVFLILLEIIIKTNTWSKELFFLLLPLETVCYNITTSAIKNVKKSIEIIMISLSNQLSKKQMFHDTVVDSY